MSASSTPPSPDGLGPLLLQIRRSQGRSQQRLADQLCAVAGVDTVSRHEVSRWERGERIPSPYWLAWLSEVLGVTLAELERATARSRAGRASRRPAYPRRRPGVSVWPWRIFASVNEPGQPCRMELRMLPPGPGGTTEEATRVLAATLAGRR